jgi:hypothetical protein
MRYLLLMYPGAQGETGVLPEHKPVFEAMMRFNEELARAGALLAVDGLHPSAKGARVSFPNGNPVVKDGPFTEAKELVGGYWLLQVRSREEALEWAKRVPPHGSAYVELRQVLEASDFPAEFQAALDNPLVNAALGPEGA